MMLWRTLRGRLVLSMVLVFVLAVGLSTLMDRFDADAPRLVGPGRVAGMLDREPYQDGLVLALFSLPALALIWLVSSWSLRPLLRASEEARRAGPSSPAARLSQSGMPAELAPLVDAVNGALDRMAHAFEAERRFTENAAHELRTPLAVLGLRLQRARLQRARLQRARQDSRKEAHQETHIPDAMDWPAIEADLAQMNRLVAQLLDLARKEHAGRTAPVAGLPCINLARVAREAAAAVLPVAEAAGRELTVDLPDTLCVLGRPEDLTDALRNLLDNALLHGGGVITLRGDQDARQVVVDVSDEGAGIPAAMRQTVFERFGKGAGSRGSGLGLAIVREVARGHGGDVVVMPGVVCRLRFSLPAADSAPQKG